jgi:hypothetical protein
MNRPEYPPLTIKDLEDYLKFNKKRYLIAPRDFIEGFIDWYNGEHLKD